jgi:hypothetical protein
MSVDQDQPVPKDLSVRGKNFLRFLPTMRVIINDPPNLIQPDTYNLLCISPCNALYQISNFQLRVMISPTATLANFPQKGDSIGARKRCPGPAKT